ncbi:MAG TPA: L,D-transpeptidase [Bryobacteraceae bacterium]|jgi:lipoprotein-anchoring transpeptidase ErfK/SrfK|nr:L,D-transpeptidase [Bryobacteraceae bacterium]
MRLYWATFAFIATVSISAETHAGKQKGHADRAVLQRRPLVDAGSIDNPSQPNVTPGHTGSGVVRAQILLARAHFSCGEIDGNFGSNLSKTLAAYQQERQLPATGIVDGATWAALNADTAPALMDYRISAEDEKGPFLPIPTDLMEQAKLPALGYASPLEELAERFHASPGLLHALNSRTDFTKAEQTVTVPNLLTLPPGKAANVVVSKSESSVRAYDAEGKLLAFYSATIGSEHDPLPVGDWKIRGVSHNPEFHYNASLFWDSKSPDEKAVIQPGPNNPVGSVWIDLSKEHYGIHGTPEPSMIGHTTSHGCIRLTNWDAVELAAMVKPGTPAVLKE